jgi:flagellar basal body-associated protein FliL
MSNPKTSVTCIIILYLCISVLLFFIGYGCSKKDVPADDRFIGSWRMKKGKGYKDLTFLADGTWQSKVRKEGRSSKANAMDEEFSGTWTVADGSLNMTATQAKVGNEWVIGEAVSFAIIEITESTMQIKKPNGTIETWTQIEKQQADGKEVPAQVLSIKPLVVNLNKEKPVSKDRYLCIELKFILKPNNEKAGAPLPKLHPKVREAMIFHLSSLTYSEINTMEKLGAVRNMLLQIINPYAKGQIESISIQNITVTSQWKSVEAFFSHYEEIPAETKKENENEKKSEEGGH